MDCTRCPRPGLARNLCSTHYAEWRRRRVPYKRRVAFGQSVAERLATHSDRAGGPESCWPWTASRGRGGYGQLAVDRGGPRWRTEPAHRVALEEHIGRRLLSGEMACHHCDNRACVNPTHLYVGNAKTNARDVDLRNRRPREWTQRRVRGADHFRARFTDDDIRAIRERIAGGSTQQAIATEFGVSQSTISHIVRGNTWRHVE